jgi:hypothetical protein
MRVATSSYLMLSDTSPIDTELQESPKKTHYKIPEDNQTVGNRSSWADEESLQCL